MRGKLIKFVSKPHFCNPPFFTIRFWKGTIWECDCGKQWELYFDFMGDKDWKQINNPIQ